MKNLKISTRLYGAFATLTLLLMGLAGLAALQLSTMRAATVEIADNWLPSVRAANEIDSKLLAARMTVLGHVMNTAAAAMEASWTTRVDRRLLGFMNTPCSSKRCSGP